MSHEGCKNWKRAVYVHPVTNHINHSVNTCRMTEIMYPWPVMIADIRYSGIDYYLMKPPAYRTGINSFSRTGYEQIAVRGFQEMFEAVMPGMDSLSL